MKASTHESKVKTMVTRQQYCDTVAENYAKTAIEILDDETQSKEMKIARLTWTDIKTLKQIFKDRGGKSLKGLTKKLDIAKAIVELVNSQN